MLRPFLPCVTQRDDVVDVNLGASTTQVPDFAEAAFRSRRCLRRGASEPCEQMIGAPSQWRPGVEVSPSLLAQRPDHVTPRYAGTRPLTVPCPAGRATGREPTPLVTSHSVDVIGLCPGC